ncbi:VC0807 family protein [Saccharopolyspora hordei]|uniref:DUF3159 domain-containing protein n=1 Tax=Saccharopolyspora hordei TaxID=1838 RepID=A0A853ATY2_9PSEU|nr:VC0807 family protein [Saccharopolyspora hordei]NYI86114.1 hypothetical protein [Saccharopolyspora hordei]
MRQQVQLVLVDAGLPIALYYGLRLLGCDPLAALLVSAVVPAVRLLHGLLVRRRVEPFAAFVLVVVALSVATSFVTGSPRVLLAKDAWLVAACGVGALLTLLGRPVVFTLGRVLAVRSGWHDDWDRQWAESAAFRRVWRVLTVLWGVVLLAEAGVKVLLAFTLPIDLVPVLSTVQWLVVLVLLQVVTQLYLRRPAVRAVVDGTGRS